MISAGFVGGLLVAVAVAISVQWWLGLLVAVACAVFQAALRYEHARSDSYPSLVETLLVEGLPHAVFLLPLGAVVYARSWPAGIATLVAYGLSLLGATERTVPWDRGATAAERGKLLVVAVCVGLTSVLLNQAPLAEPAGRAAQRSADRAAAPATAPPTATPRPTPTGPPRPAVPSPSPLATPFIRFWVHNTRAAQMWSGAAGTLGVVSFGTTSAVGCAFEVVLPPTGNARHYVWNPYSDNYFWIDRDAVRAGPAPERHPGPRPPDQNCAEALFDAESPPSPGPAAHARESSLR